MSLFFFVQVRLILEMGMIPVMAECCKLSDVYFLIVACVDFRSTQCADSGRQINQYRAQKQTDCEI